MIEDIQNKFNSFTNTILVLDILKENKKQYYKLQCTVCNNIWNLRSDDLNRLLKNKKGGCRICSNRLISKKNILDQNKEKRSILEKQFYIQNIEFSINMKFICKVCNYEFEDQIHNLYGKLDRKQNPCINCKNIELLNSLDYQNNLLIKNNINNIKLIQRKTCNITTVQCSICNHIWDVYFYNIIRAKNKWNTNGCPNCDNLKNRTSSSQQLEIEEFVKQYVEIIPKYKLLNKKEIDIYIPGLRIGLEFNGVFYHSPDTTYRNLDEYYHKNKTKDALNENIRLIHIFSPHWIHKKEICKNKILNLIGVNKKYLRSNQYTIKSVKWCDAKIFLNKNHLMGCGEIPLFSYGIYDKQETLIGVATFTNKRNGNFRERDDEVVEFNRFATSIRCYGAMQKIISIIKNRHPYLKEIISYADLCWTNINNNIYNKNGFKLVSITEPNYWWCKNDIFLGRRNTMKHKLKDLLGDNFNPNESESANMLLNGYYRVWDCGHAKYILILK